ncbi:MAG: O-antigen ligase family protein [Verrucomicrobia bacterium]|nr:O-antigen ligase family protein [Verrucomicrobiota bacterium]
METKDLIALAMLLVAIPAGVLVATFSQRARDAAFFLMVAGTVITDRLDVNVLSHYWYRGTSRGLEISFVDLLAISVFAGSVLLPRPGNSRFYWPASFGLMLVFFVYACFSVMFSTPKIYGVFELSKMVRGFFFFLAAAFYVRSQRELGIVVLALGCAVCLEGAWGLKQKLIGGIYRVPGTLEHENSLSMYICLVAPIFVAATTSSLPKLLRMFSIVAIGAAALCSVLTISRAGIPIFALVMLGATAFCATWRITPRKIIATALLGLCIAGMFYQNWDSLKERYAEASFADEYLDDEQEGRGYYLRVANVIVADKFFGVGLNNWSFWVSKKYGAMVGRPYDDYGAIQGNNPDDDIIENLVWAAPAHNLAALTVGELGVPGLILFTLLWGHWFLMGLRFLFWRTPEAMHRLGVGIFFGVCGIFLHSLTEWTFRQPHIFLTFNMLVGTLASLCYAKRHARKPAVEAVIAQAFPEHEYPEVASTRASTCA